MPPVIKGKDVLSALNELKNPSNLNEIVDHMSAKYEASKTALAAAVKTILDAGVQHGYIEESDDKYRTEYKPTEEVKDDQIQINPAEPQRQESNEQVETSKNREIAVRNKKNWTWKRPYLLHSSEDENEDEDMELRDQGDCCGSRYRRRSRSRGRHGKSHSRRRTRRRRRE
ncbi:uncharacterized protein LOC111688174 isoform X1 [Lucilia cuprina]|uniref:uncharacterized protein LOC111688174 isoform X1 n=2 Tax=Lucilia cuprina TaxID=7375 RepID=UPI001F05FD0F|nr:uncharacterized protein LOC111688174 isoform X1 [Lucilia cuprina]